MFSAHRCLFSFKDPLFIDISEPATPGHKRFVLTALALVMAAIIDLKIQLCVNIFEKMLFYLSINPWVPTGIKMGVRTVECGRTISAALARLVEHFPTILNLRAVLVAPVVPLPTHIFVLVIFFL